MIQDFGNCGNMGKVQRIFDAIKTAQKFECKLVFIFDPLIYGKEFIKINNPKDCHFYFDDSNLFIEDGPNIRKFGWWDIIQINVLF